MDQLAGITSGPSFNVKTPVRYRPEGRRKPRGSRAVRMKAPTSARVKAPHLIRNQGTP